MKAYRILRKMAHMISFKAPTTIDKRAIDWPLSYTQRAATRGDFPEGFNHDRNEVAIGSGEATWQAAKLAMQRWQHYPASWTRVKTFLKGIQPNDTAGVYFRLFGLWWANHCRILYLNDREEEWGFAYGTLTRHVECGEEYFYIRRDTTGKIFYGIQAFSKPNYWFVWLGYPLARFFQRRFVKQSLAIMQNIKTTSNEK